MSKCSHTPGPWEFEISSDGSRAEVSCERWAEFARIWIQVEGEDFPEGRANARLIAAAPDLLAACQEASLQLQYLADKFNATGTGTAVLAKLDAAIAKAEGR